MHKPDRPTTCDVSDLLNEIVQFVEENPLWHEDDLCRTKLGVAYTILRTICGPDMVTDEEYECVMNIHRTLQEGAAE
jgi:hypothetical protein